jgi:ankyrin repeat protein
VEVTRALLEAGAEVYHADNLGYTALGVAAHHGRVEAIHVLVAAGADLNRANNA